MSSRASGPRSIRRQATTSCGEHASLEPLVSVVIPTRERPAGAVAAARSALAQTLRDLEVIVVIDGPEPQTESAVCAIDDDRLRVTTLGRPAGPGGARNAGVSQARGEWVAFLDDDDRWLPPKLEHQVETARSSPHGKPIVACRLVARDGARARVLPRRLPGFGEPLSEYLFARRGLFWGEALVHTSTLLARRELLDRVPFRADLPKHEDWDWLLRATAEAGATVAFVADRAPLAEWTVGQGRPRASTRPDWRFSRSWLREAEPLVTPRAYAAFLLTVAAADAERQRSLPALWALPWEAFSCGRPRVRDILIYLAIWLIPARVRSALAARAPS